MWSGDVRLLHCVLASDYETRDTYARNNSGAARATLRRLWLWSHAAIYAISGIEASSHGC